MACRDVGTVSRNEAESGAQDLQAALEKLQIQGAGGRNDANHVTASEKGRPNQGRGRIAGGRRQVEVPRPSANGPPSVGDARPV